MGRKFIKIVNSLIIFYSVLFIIAFLLIMIGYINITKIDLEELKTPFIVITLCVFIIKIIYESL